MDVRLTAHQGDGRKAAYLDNLYRNKKKSAFMLESFPGYRRLFESLHSTEKLNGVFCHRFKKKEAILLHIGDRLYRADTDTLTKEPVCLGTVNDYRSVGCSFGDAFYLFDGRDILRLSDDGELTALGDEPYTSDMEEANRLPATRAYIPTVLENGKEKEARNLLTAYYDIVDKTTESRRNYRHFGLKLRVINDGGREALEVYGVEEGYNTLFVPNEAEVLGSTLPIVSVADGAFQSSALRTAVFSENVKKIGRADGDRGAFSACTSLECVAFFGIEEIGAYTFQDCVSLKEIVLPRTLFTVSETAFDRCISLERAYCEDASFTAFDFDETVTVFPETLLVKAEVGEEVRFEIDPDKYSDVYGVNEVSKRAMESFRKYGGWSSGVMGDNLGYYSYPKRPIALCGLCFECHLASQSDRYAFLTVEGEGARFTENEEPIAIYDIPIPDDCRALASVTLDGEAAAYKVVYRYEAGRSYATALRFTLPQAKSRVVKIRAFSKGRPTGLLASYFSDEGLVAADAVRSAGALCLARDTLYLSGSPDYRGAVFHGSLVTSQGELAPYFPADAFKVVTPSEVYALLLGKDRLTVLAEKGVYYLEQGVVADDIGAFDGVVYRDIRYLLLADGVYRMREGVSVSYTHLEKISGAIAPDISDFSKGSLAVFRGYLVLLLGDRAYLADLDEEYREEGVSLNPWYRLTSLGDRDGNPFVKMLSLGDSLYFFTETGDAFLVDDAVKDYDTRRVTSVAVSEAYDMDCGYLYKKPLRKGLVLSLLGLSESSEVVISAAGEDGVFERIGSVIPRAEEGQSETVAVLGALPRFIRQTVKVEGSGLAFRSLSFRYRVLKRRVR